MKIKMTIKDYTTMSLKELEQEHLKANQELLDMMTKSYYTDTKEGKNCFRMQKELVDYLYDKISKKHQEISKMKGKK